MKTALAGVCSLDGEQLKERARHWVDLGECALQAATRGDKSVFEYRYSPDVEARLTELVEAERKCCAIGGMTWDLEKDGEKLLMSVSVPESMRDSKEMDLIFALIGGPHATR